jgi:hypothetical protein
LRLVATTPRRARRGPRRHADQRGDLLAVQATELRHIGEQRLVEIAIDFRQPVVCDN